MITKFYRNRRFLDGLFEIMLPDGHRMRKLFESLDFSFVDEICDKYYKNNETGRPAESPERIMRMIFILFYEGIPGETRLVERITTDISYRFFCRFHIDEEIPDHSTLWVFRKRLGPEGFQEIFERILLQCIEQGLVEGKRFMFDCTNTNAKGTPYSKYKQAFILSKALLEYLESSHASTTEGDENKYSPELLKLVSQVASQVTDYKYSGTIERKLAESLSSAGKETPGDLLGPEDSLSSNEPKNVKKSDDSSASEGPDDPDDNPGGGQPFAGETGDNSGEHCDSVNPENPAGSVNPEINAITCININNCNISNSTSSSPEGEKSDNAVNPDKPGPPVKPDNNSDRGNPIKLPDKEELKIVAEKLRETLPHTAGDSDARTGHTSSHKTFTGYLDGVMTDDARQVVVSVELYPGNVRQSDTVIDAMKNYAKKIATLLNPGETPEIALDSAFDYPEVYETSKECGLNAITSLRKRPSKKKIYDTDYFKMDVNGQLRCPANHTMLRSGKPDSQGCYSYRGGNKCKNCPLLKSCTNSKKGRTVQLNPTAKLDRQRQLKKAESDEYRKTLRQRMVIEGVFGNGKTYHNLGRALYRSAEMVKIQLLLWATVHNALKVFRYGVSSGSGSPEACKSPAFVDCDLALVA